MFLKFYVRETGKIESNQPSTIALVSQLIHRIKKKLTKFTEETGWNNYRNSFLDKLEGTLSKRLTDKNPQTRKGPRIINEVKKNISIACLLDPRQAHKTILEKDYDISIGWFKEMILTIDEEFKNEIHTNSDNEDLKYHSKSLLTREESQTNQKKTFREKSNSTSDSGIASDEEREIQYSGIIEDWEKEISNFFQLPQRRWPCEIDNLYFWFEQHKETFPRVFELARRILPIPATSTEDERQFSLAKKRSTKTRNRLLPATLREEVLCAANISTCENMLFQAEYFD